jgi:hypothetical protein
LSEHPVWAVNALRCLGVRAGERVQVLVDEPFADVGLAICRAALERGAYATAHVVPDAARPLRHADEPFLRSLDATDVVVFWFCQGPDGELEPFRLPIYRRLPETGTRLAYGGRMDRSILEHEMTGDYEAIAVRSQRLVGLLGDATRIRVTTPAGTDCTFDVSGRSWLVDDGDLSAPGAFGNLPAGEVFVAPLASGADGICVIDRSVALEPERVLANPVSLVFEGGRIVSVTGDEEAEIVRRAIAQAGAGADVVAELGIGTNDRARITGSVITDEKVLGTAHVAFGDNTGAYGGDNPASIHVDCVMADATVEADGRVVFDRGRFPGE